MHNRSELISNQYLANSVKRYNKPRDIKTSISKGAFGVLILGAISFLFVVAFLHN